jgi:hypothetical protein
VKTTEQVVKNYLRKIYDKLNVADRLELALYSMHHRLLDGYVFPSSDGRSESDKKANGAAAKPAAAAEGVSERPASAAMAAVIDTQKLS